MFSISRRGFFSSLAAVGLWLRHHPANAAVRRGKVNPHRITKMDLCIGTEVPSSADGAEVEAFCFPLKEATLCEAADFVLSGDWYFPDLREGQAPSGVAGTPNKMQFRATLEDASGNKLFTTKFRTKLKPTRDALRPGMTVRSFEKFFSAPTVLAPAGSNFIVTYTAIKGDILPGSEITTRLLTL